MWGVLCGSWAGRHASFQVLLEPTLKVLLIEVFFLFGAGLAGAKLKVGQYLNCIIEEVKGSGGVVSLSIGHSEVSTAIATEEHNWTLNNLLPGLVVKAQVQKVSHSLLLLFSKITVLLIEVVPAHSLKLCHLVR